MEKYTSDDVKSENRKRIITYIIILIIIILCLITSCSCTSKYIGKIGDLFRNEEDVIIDGGSGDKETIKNGELTFDIKNLVMSVSDNNAKIGFSYKKINPDKFTCTTSDANVATCYVSNGYVVVIPKSIGNVTVTLQTETNGKIYQATANVTITDANKYIALSKNNGTINLAYSKTKKVGYKLVGISGKVVVTSSDPSVAEATAKNGVLTIKGKSTGSATITLTVEYNGVTYKTDYNLKVINNIDNSGSNTSAKDALLTNIKVSSGKLTPTFNSKTKKYNVTIDNNVDKITIKATANSKSTITYIFNGKEYKSFDNIPMAVGDNIVNIKVVNGSGKENNYTVIVTRKDKSPELNNDSTLSNITTNKGVLTPTFNKDTKDYKVTVDYSVSNITLKATASNNKSTITYIFNGKEYKSFDNIPMAVGDNVVSIKVVSESGKESTYTVVVTRNEKLNNDSTLSNITTNKGVLTPTFNKDTKEYEITVNSSVNDITLTATASNSKSTITYSFNNKEYKEFKNIPLEDGANVVFITVTAEDGTETVYTVTVNKYFLNTPQKEYEISYDSNGSEKDIILYTNIFNNKVNTILSTDKKTMTICDANNASICVKVSSTSDIIKSLEYTGESTGPTSLPIKVTADGIGTGNIHVVATANGVTVNEFDITFKVVQKYIVTLKANGGLFNEFETEQTFKISPEDSPIDLVKYGKPYYQDDEDNCIYYEFIGYADELDEDKTIIYDLENKNLINYSDLSSDITLVAIYNMEDKKIQTTESKTLWLVDVPIFRDKEYYDKFGKDRPIYPGAQGEYTMNFKNESDDTLVITGMILKEDTICVDKDGIKGCLNMGYIIKDAHNNYHYGSSNAYEVLNKTGNVIDWPGNHNEADFTFNPATNADTTIGPKGTKNDELEITIHWKWVEFDDYSDRVDTLIGNQAAAKLIDDSINDLYTLYVGIKLDVIRDECNK